MPTRPARIAMLTGTARRLVLPALLAGAALGSASAQETGETTVAHGVSTFGELKYGPDFKHLDYVNPDAPKGGEISIEWQGTFDSFNPYTRKGRAGLLANIATEQMMVGVADEIGALYCLICETVEYPEDRSWAIFTIRDEAAFSDGTPITAEDVVFTHDLFAREGLLSFRTVLDTYVESVEALDEKRVKYTLKPGTPLRDRIQTVGSLPVLSKDWFEETGASLDESRLDPGIGSGPYALESYEINRQIVYARDPDYWGRDLPINRGRNNFDRIRVEYFGDANAALEGFKAGAYTFRNENSSKNWATAYEFPGVGDTIVKTELPDGTIATGQSYVMNLRREKFQDKRVREAIGLMFNFEWANETLFYGAYDRIDSFWENSELEAVGTPTPEEVAILEPLVEEGLLDPAILEAPAVPAPESGPRQLDRGNLRAASALLREAGWEVGPDGMRRKDGEILSIEILEDSPTFDRVHNPFVQNLRALGIDARLNRVDPAQYTDLVRSHEFDMIVDQFPLGYEPGSNLMQYMGCEGVDDVFNSMGLCDPAVDRLIRVVMEADTKEKLVPAVRALDRVLRDYRFWVPQWYKNVHSIAYYDYLRHPEELPPYSLGHLDFWWADADAYEALQARGAL